MTPDQVLHELLRRLRANPDEPVIVGWDEVRRWPPGVLNTLTQDGLLSEAAPATSLECEGCEEHCWVPVHVFPAERSRQARAFIACDYRDDIGRVSVDFIRLWQWQLTSLGLIQLLYRSQKEALVSEDCIRKRLWDLLLAPLLTIRNRHLVVDSQHFISIITNLDSVGSKATRPLLLRKGDYWDIQFGGKQALQKHSKGLLYIAYLLKYPGKEFSPTELSTEVEGTPVTAGTTYHNDMTEEQLDEEENMSITGLGFEENAVDKPLVNAYRQEIERLKEEILKAEIENNNVKVAELEKELREYKALLHGEINDKGLPRQKGSVSEDERSRITQLINRAKKNLSKQLPELGQHLQHLSTGSTFTYNPPRDQSVKWII